MNRSTLRPLATVLLILLVAGPSALAPRAARAGLGDRLKKKLEDKANKKTDDAVDQAAGDAKPKSDTEAASGDEPAGRAGKPGAAGSGKVATISTKFDFVPGDQVLLFDDFTQDELGEFPAKWRLSGGTFEVVDREGERWLRCTSTDGRVRMKAAGTAPLPEFWTLEFDLYCDEPVEQAYNVYGLTADENTAWTFTYASARNFVFRAGPVFASTPVAETAPLGGRHHIMVMARGNGLKVYLDRERFANAPEIETQHGPVQDIEFRLWSPTHPMITNVRFAEGCRPPKDLLSEGKLVTYGIRFATGSDVVLPESAPVLRQVASWLEANPTAKLAITGHTDNVGTAASNLDLSKRRAASVARVLAAEFGAAADRFTTDGKGDTQPVAANAKPEGRAMNRRVEFAKI